MVVLRRIYDKAYVYIGYVNFILFVSSIIPSIMIRDIHGVTIMGVFTSVLMASIMLWLPAPKSAKGYIPDTTPPHKRIIKTEKTCACDCDCSCHNADTA